MARGKQTCKILKEIRRQIAEANGIVAPIIGSFEIVPSGNVSPLSTIPLTVIVSAITGMLPFKRFCGSCTVCASEVTGISIARDAAEIPARVISVYRSV